ncbi:MAG: LuxR C-terminal-related transcriptional regulator [Candidatus Limnocylindrales bacterium]
MGRHRREQAVERTAILDRIERDTDAALVLVVASAGYGKSMLLEQLGQRVRRSAYLRISERHRDPTVLFQDVARVMDAIEPMPEDILGRISSRSLEPGLQAASRLAQALGNARVPVALLFDDIHLLRDRRAVDAVGVFIDLLPDGMRVVAAGHDASALRLARLQTLGRLIEIGEDDLAFDEDEVRTLAARLELDPSDAHVEAIIEWTRGWPVAVSLALGSRAMAASAPSSATAGMERSVAEYIRTELLDPLDPEQRAWLLRTSVLDTMSGALCDHALETRGSLSRLRALHHSSLLVQAVDHAGTIFRYHPLLRELLRDTLEAERPDVAKGIAARAAMWCHAEGEPIEALEYARRSGDRDLTARLMAQEVWPLHWTGRIATLERWIEWFDSDGVRDRYPAIAVLAGFICAIDGRRHESELWLAAAEHSPQDAEPMPDGSAAAAWVAVLRGMILAQGVEAAQADARAAEAGMRGDSPFMPGVRLLSAVASMLAGLHEEATEQAREAVVLAEVRGAIPGFAMATGLEVSLALRSGHRELARRRLEHGLSVIRAAGLEEYVLTFWVHALAARVAVSGGSAKQARQHLAQVHRMRPMSTAATPWLAVPARLAAIEALIGLEDVASARTLMREVDDILRIRPRLGSIIADVEAVRTRLDRISDVGAAHWTLTAAELRVLQYLPTHLTFAEIAERLYVSPHTVKSQAVAIYSKLGVSSRRAAIETAVEYGLIDGSALRFPLGPGLEAGIG